MCGVMQYALMLVTQIMSMHASVTVVSALLQHLAAQYISTETLSSLWCSDTAAWGTEQRMDGQVYNLSVFLPAEIHAPDRVPAGLGSSGWQEGSKVRGFEDVQLCHWGCPRSCELSCAYCSIVCTVVWVIRWHLIICIKCMWYRQPFWVAKIKASTYNWLIHGLICTCSF